MPSTNRHKEIIENNAYHALRWSDLECWAGKAILDRGKCYKDRVTDIVIVGENQLVATVEGQARYLTQTWLDGSTLLHRCSCPYDWGPCKHAVAVILVYLDHVRSGASVPTISQDALGATVEAHEIDNRSDKQPDSHIASEKIREVLEGMPTEDLIEWATGFLTRHPALSNDFPPELQPAAPSPEKPIISEREITLIRQEIRNVTSDRFYEGEWYEDFEGYGEMPDYSSIELQFGNLLDGGYTEALLDLGEELLILAGSQIGDSDVDEDVLGQLTDCLALVVEAMRISGRSESERISWYWDMQLKDDYNLLDGIPLPTDDTKMTQADWLQVAQNFTKRLDPVPEREHKGGHRNYRRNQVLNCAVTALVNAGENDRAVELMVSELPYCGNHIGLVDHLLMSGDHERARYWSLEGFRQTIGVSPNIAWSLAEKRQEVATKQRDWSQVAALEAEFFFVKPGIKYYQQVQDACRKSGHWEQVRPALLHYLDTGRFLRSDTNWPLPEPELTFPAPQHSRTFPDYDTLISVALYENCPDEAVRWYRQTSPRQVSNAGFIAGAVKKTHPDISLDIWRAEVEALIDFVKPAAYRDAMRPLKNIKSLMQSMGLDEDYREYVSALRNRHKRKPRLMDELDYLERKDRKILDG